MPFQPLDVPSLAGFEVFPASLLHQGEAVGGDALFEEVRRKDGRHLFLTIDVCGHGHKANRIVVDLRDQYLPQALCEDNQPAVLLKVLNDLLQNEFFTSGRFVAALAVLVDADGSLIASNAGQPNPWIGQPGGSWQNWPVPGGTFLGVADPDGEYQEGPETLPSGSLFLAFTDGVTEAGRGHGQLFEAGQLAPLLAALPAGLSAGQVVMRLLEALQIHAGTPWPEDDTTVLCLGRG